jgi:hypothetical protein
MKSEENISIIPDESDTIDIPDVREVPTETEDDL